MICVPYTFLDGPTVKKPFCELVRPLLDYANTVWSPMYMKYAKLLENVQRCATWLVPELKNMEYI